MTTRPGISTETILKLAARPDGFYVHRYKYSERNKGIKCERLVREGKLVRARTDRTHVYYKAAAK